MRIAYFIHGRGRGHAARSLPVIRTLRERGHDIVALAGGAVIDLASSSDAIVPVQTVGPGPALLSRSRARVDHDLQMLRDRHIDCVVSDGDMPSVIAARISGLRTICAGHELVFSRCRQTTTAGAWTRLKQCANTWHSALLPHESVAVHFLPVRPCDGFTWVARPEPPAELGPVQTVEGRMVAYFRDGNGREALDEAVKNGCEVHHFGRRASGVDGVIEHGFEPDRFQQLLRSSQWVVGSAGSNLISECIYLRKPFAVLHADGDAEQTLNARMVHNAGVGVGGRLADARATVNELIHRSAGGDLVSLDLEASMSTVTEVMAERLAVPTELAPRRTWWEWMLGVTVS